MKISYVLLSCVAMLCIVTACKKKPMTNNQPTTVLADSPNVANSIDSAAVASHYKTDTFNGGYYDVEGIGGAGNPATFYVQYVKPGMAIVSTNSRLQTEDLAYGAASTPQPFHTTIVYNGPGTYYSGRITIDIADSLTLTWSYVREGHPDDHVHNCRFKGGRTR